MKTNKNLLSKLKNGRILFDIRQNAIGYTLRGEYFDTEPSFFCFVYYSTKVTEVCDSLRRRISKRDRLTTTTNIIYRVWPKLTPTNLNILSRVLLTSVPDIFPCRGAKLGRCPSQWKLVSQGWGTCPNQPHKHIFWSKVNVCRCNT